MVARTAVGFAAIAVLVALLSTWPSRAAAAAPSGQGLVGGWGVGDTGVVSFPHSLQSQLPIMHEAQAGWVRINFRLGNCYQTWTTPVSTSDVNVHGCDPGLVGQTALQAYDEVVNTAQQSQLQVLGLLSNEAWQGVQDQWVANNAETTTGNGDNPYLDDFAQQAAGVLAQHFAGRINRWEIWNEPNAWTSFDNAGHVWGSTWIYPSNFAWLLTRSYSAIKQANGSATVVSGGILGTDAGGTPILVPGPGSPKPLKKYATVPTWQRTPNGKHPACISNVPTSGAGYLCDAYAMGIAMTGWAQPYPFDAIGEHLYIDQAAVTTNNRVKANIEDVRQAYLSYEGSKTSKQTELTEFGWTSQPGSATYSADANRQAQNLQVAYSVFQGTHYVTRAYWFSVQDVPEGNIWYGLVQGNYVANVPDPANLALRKPAFAAYQRYAK
jgi:hypothetical protein